MDILKRDLTVEEKTVLEKHLFVNENENLAVVILNTLARKGEYIVNISEDENWPDGKNEWGNIIVCQMLWLVRQDEKMAGATGENKILKNSEIFVNTAYDEFEYPDNIHIVGDNDAFVKNHITKLRDEETDVSRYRYHSDNVSQRLLIAATASLGTKFEEITTGTGVKMLAPRLDEEIVIVEIPRASKPMSNAAMDLLPESPMGVMLLQRNEEDPESKAKLYYNKLPIVNDESVVVVVDPMLATGGSMSDAIDEIKNHNPKEIRVVCQIAAPEGIHRLQAKHPDVEIWIGELDSHLNETNYIIPGLGDAGDRYHGT